jgi:DNA-directed RNA polymerase specialized sigma subunit
MGLGNIFLSRNDLDSFTTPVNRLESNYAEAYRSWKTNDNEETRENLLTTLSPAIERNVRGIAGGDPNYLRIRAKILAMNAMGKYDPEKSSLDTYLNHQLMPLRRTARQQMNILGLPDRLLMASRQLENAETELTDELGRLPTTVELADKLSLSLKQIERIRQMGHARNTGRSLTQDEEGQISDAEAVTRRLPDEYRHQYVLSALRNDPKSAIIYEHDEGLHGRVSLSTAALAEKLGLSPGAISQRRNRIDVIRNNAQREIYGN